MASSLTWLIPVGRRIQLETSTYSKYPAKQHARSVAKHLSVKTGLVYLSGTPTLTLRDSDQPVPFRQRRFFYYLSGVDFADCIVTYDIGTDKLCLFIPPVNPAEVIWLGPTPGVKECEERYDVDHVYLTSWVEDYVLDWLKHNDKSTIFILHQHEGPEMKAPRSRDSTSRQLRVALDSTLLLPAMEAARVIKSDHEVGLIRRANIITSDAHRHVLRGLRDMDNETQIEAAFQGSCLWLGAKKQAYGIIAGSGPNASILHYVANNQPLEGRQLVCLDAGCEWECYASDVTRSFPISGTFSDEAKEIYAIVEKMQEQCILRVKPGIVFRNLHYVAMEIAVRGLMKLGILHNGTFEEVFPSGTLFFPHGLGHHIGLECHDVSGGQRLLANIPSMEDLQKEKYPHSPSSATNGFTSTTSSKPYDAYQKLAANMVITIEPGIYFSRYALQQFTLRAPQLTKYIDYDVLERYYPVGGIRIEDDILVTATGYENLTTAPKGEQACRIIRGEAETDEMF